MTKFKGFTLIELIVGMGLLSVITFVLLSASVTGIQSFSITSAKQSNTSAFLEMYGRMDNYTRIAVEFPTSCSAAQCGADYTASSTTIIMRLASLSEIETNECNYSDYVIFTLNGKELLEIVVADSHSSRKSHNQIVAKNLDAFSITQAKPDGAHRTVTVNATITQTEAGRTVNQSHAQTMVARND